MDLRLSAFVIAHGAASLLVEVTVNARRKYTTPEEIEKRQIEMWNSPNRMIYNMKSVLKRMIPGRGSEQDSLTMLGCYPEDFRWHIERQFYPHKNTGARMNWQNKAGWHFDHIIPVHSFSQSCGALRECWHWTNLRPLWEDENFSKTSHIEHCWHVPFDVRKFWLPRDTFIGEDGLTHHNSERVT